MESPSVQLKLKEKCTPSYRVFLKLIGRKISFKNLKIKDSKFLVDLMSHSIKKKDDKFLQTLPIDMLLRNETDSKVDCLGFNNCKETIENKVLILTSKLLLDPYIFTFILKYQFTEVHFISLEFRTMTGPKGLAHFTIKFYLILSAYPFMIGWVRNVCPYATRWAKILICLTPLILS